MEISLEEKVALITGGSRGIGRAIGELFARCGARVVLSSRKAESLEQACIEIEQATGSKSVSYVVGNAGNEEVPRRVVAEVLAQHGSLDVLVNNAGTNPHFGSVMDISPSQADKVTQVNLRGVLLWTQAAWNMYWKDEFESEGSVINMASIGGLSVDKGIAFYNVSKAGVIHLTRQMAAELGPRVRVNSISPGLVKTDMARALWETHGDAIGSALPLGRLGEPADIANAALFLASSMSSWMTGENIVVDGGALVR